MPFDLNQPPQAGAAENFVRPSNDAQQESAFDRFATHYASRCAGVGLFVGDFVMMASEFHRSTLSFVGGWAYVASSFVQAIFGERGFKPSLIIGQIGAGMVFWDDLWNGKELSWAGFVGFGIGNSLGLATEYLEKNFKEHANILLRNTLGRPRLTMAITFIASNLSLLVNARNPGEATAMVTFIGSNCFYALSRPLPDKALTAMPLPH